MSKKTALGKGFGSLIPEDFDNSILLDKKDRIHKIAINKILPNPNQPRTTFEKSSIEGLSESIKTYGILQPLVLTPHGEKYQIIAGERRFRAAKLAELNEVPALIRSSKELEKIEIGLVENVQRVDLSPLEQAVSIAKLNEQFNIDMKDIAKRLGKANTTVVNIVRLLQLPINSQSALADKKITEGHARAILALKHDTKLQDELLRNIISLKWSVRRAEEFVNQQKQKKDVSNKPKKTSVVETSASKNLSRKLKTRVVVRPGVSGGKIEITYRSGLEMKRIFTDLEK